MKLIAFQGTWLDDLWAFPETARRETGHQLDQVQSLLHHRLRKRRDDVFWCSLVLTG